MNRLGNFGPSPLLVVRSAGLTVVADQLEPANNLADGEEAETFSKDDATRGQLGPRYVAHLLDGGGGLRGRLARRPPDALEEGAGVLELLPQVLEI